MVFEPNKLKRIDFDAFKITFDKCPKPILFWDTCALLDIMRFFFKEKKGDKKNYKSIKNISDYIKSKKIYSISSDICIQELADHFLGAKTKMSDYIKDVNQEYEKHIELLNYLNKKTYRPKDLTKGELSTDLESIVCSIAYETSFIKVSKEIAYDALQRIILKDPPAKKKQEFKDCAIWETMMTLCRGICPDAQTKIFYTTNTSDFCSANKFNYILEQEGKTLNFNCYSDINDVYDKLKP